MKKTKRITAIILSAFMTVSAFSALSVSAATVDSNAPVVSADDNLVSGDFKYSVLDDGTVEISKYVGNDSDVTIPDEIDEKKVTSIGKGAFENNISIKNIEMSNNILSIYDGAYYNCQSLETIKLSNSLTEILVGAFGNCLSLKRIDLPDSLSYVDDFAFGNCKNLEKVHFSNGVKEKGTTVRFAKSIFENCVSLTSINLPNNLKWIGYADFLGCSKIEEIIIPESVTGIVNKAFSNCNNLQRIIIPANVSFIGNDTFENCDNLTIYSYFETFAETYARANGITFIPIADKTLTDKINNIIVSGAMQEGTALNVDKLENKYEKSVATYDITLKKSGATIQPGGTITIKIPSDVKDCKVMWIKDDGTAEDMNAEYTDGCYVFTTDHLSVYALVLNKTILTGDANQDGIVNVNDVTYLQRHLAGSLNTDGSALIDETSKALFDCLDLNKDGKLTIADVTALQIYISENN